MTEPAQPLYMTVDEFVTWDDGSDTRYELIEGLVVAMAPPADRHGTIAINAGAEIRLRLGSRPPCRPVSEAGIRVGDQNYYVADVAVTCSDPSASVAVLEPFLIVEVLSPSNERTEMNIKVQAYITMPHVMEVWVVDSRKRWFQLWQRGGPDSWIVGLPLTGDASFDSPTLADRISLESLYRNTGL